MHHTDRVFLFFFPVFPVGWARLGHFSSFVRRPVQLLVGDTCSLKPSLFTVHGSSTIDGVKGGRREEYKECRKGG